MSDEYNKKVGELLKEYRLKANLTQEELGKKMGGLRKSTISMYEAGMRSISLEMTRDFCKAVGITINEFADKL